jgi:hypothetical protein
MQKDHGIQGQALKTMGTPDSLPPSLLVTCLSGALDGRHPESLTVGCPWIERGYSGLPVTGLP